MEKDIKTIDGSEIIDKLVSINRVAKVVKGREKIRFCCIGGCR